MNDDRKRYKAAGIQMNPECGINRNQLMDLLFRVDDDAYEIISFDADNAICYFIFSYDYFDRFIDRQNQLLEFKTKFIEIANDKTLENSNQIYDFDHELIYFGY